MDLQKLTIMLKPCCSQVSSPTRPHPQPWLTSTTVSHHYGLVIRTVLDHLGEVIPTPWQRDREGAIERTHSNLAIPVSVSRGTFLLWPFACRMDKRRPSPGLAPYVSSS